MLDVLRFRLSALVAAAIVMAGTPTARGGPPVASAAARDPVARTAGLFMRSCVRFAAHPNALRRWAATRHLAQIPGKPAEAYLFGLPGAVFLAGQAANALTLVSEDSGSCSVVAEDVAGSALIVQLDAALKAAGIAYAVTADGPDPHAKDLHNRGYSAHQDGRSWMMLVSTVNDPAGGEAILTTNP